MRYVHSLWTKPMLRNSRDVRMHKQVITSLWCHASSVAYLKRMGQPIILFADEYANELLSWLPYDEIIPLQVPDYAPICLWAAGKIFAYQKMQLQDVHIDGDVFIKTPKLHERIAYGVTHADLIVQSIEDEDHTANNYYKNCSFIADHFKVEFLHGAISRHTAAYNCGLVGFNNEELKRKYIENYLHCHDQISNSPEAIEAIQMLKCTQDLLFEQKNLFDIAKGYNVFNLLGSGKEAYRTALQYGYQHILGDYKWKCLPDIKKQLQNVNPDIFQQTIEHINIALDKLDK